MHTDKEIRNTNKPIQPISDLEFYKSATSFFESALKTISITHGGHKCNKIASRALSIYYGGMNAMKRRAEFSKNDAPIEPVDESKPGVDVQVNPYANGAFMGLDGYLK